MYGVGEKGWKEKARRKNGTGIVRQFGQIL